VEVQSWLASTATVLMSIILRSTPPYLPSASARHDNIIGSVANTGYSGLAYAYLTCSFKKVSIFVHES
jgi:hypothetical protein